MFYIQGVAAAPDRPRGAGAQHGEPSAVAPHAHPHARDRRRDAPAAPHVRAGVAANQVSIGRIGFLISLIPLKIGRIHKYQLFDRFYP